MIPDLQEIILVYRTRAFTAICTKLRYSHLVRIPVGAMDCSLHQKAKTGLAVHLAFRSMGIKVL